MNCPLCSDEMDQVAYRTFRCESDDVLATVGAACQPDPTDEVEPRPVDLGFVPLNVLPHEIRRDDLLWQGTKLRHVMNMRAPGQLDARLLRLGDGSSYLMQGTERIYRSVSPAANAAGRLHRLPPR